MKITINQHKILLPALFVVNPLTAGIISKTLKKDGILLTRKQILLLAKILRQYKKQHAEWNLVEVQPKSGSTINITL